MKKLPGDKREENYISEVLRVNHAGELGAVRIYQGQLAASKNADYRSLLMHMYDQEKVHYEYFNQEIKNKKVRPTILLPIWHKIGFLLGFSSAFMGKKAAMICTEAVEEVIDNHYLMQLKRLPKEQQSLIENIAKFREEEIEHKDIAQSSNQNPTFPYKLLKQIIKFGCRAAIGISKKI